jgi:hypothetical protein
VVVGWVHVDAVVGWVDFGRNVREMVTLEVAVISLELGAA